MMWDVAAGVVIGGIVLTLIRLVFVGRKDYIGGTSDDNTVFLGYAAVSVIGLAIAAWIIFVKAHW